MIRWLSMLLALHLLTCPVFGQDDEEKAKARAEAVSAQKKLALEQWQGVLGGRMPVHKETENLLVYGSVEEKDIEALAKIGERALAQARKALGVMPGDDLWPGKLIVHVFAQRQEFGTFCRRHADRSPSSDETGAHSHEREHSYVLAGPPAGEGKKPALEPEVVQQIASAVMTKKAGQLPDWFVSGFGRSVAYRLMPQQFGPERARATALMRRGKTARDVWSGNLSADEGLVLNASFVDFLVNSPAMAKVFPEIMSNFGTETMFEDVLKGVKLNPDAVAAAWWRWAPSAR